ncbi:MAG: hypothetical protein PCFJNLEI_01411 [Verrucomicrobiae bacterium]|nr:hypothetical protein [Verrucomicrobiae bacterium]
MNKLQKAVALLALAGLAQADAAIITNSGIIGRSQIWTRDNEYVLDGIVRVGSNSTLTIEAGTVIRGTPQVVIGTSTNIGTLLIGRGSKIKALGTEALPIVFTDLQDDNYSGGAKTNPQYQTYKRDNVGKWGGVALCGRAYVAKGTGSGPAPTSIQLEGISAFGAEGFYGGVDDDDDSGIMKYVSIRYNGFGLAPNNELNGLGLAGVGRETVIDHVESINSKDDGVEIWGGTVNAKYLAVWNCGDDSFDIDEGYRGKLQFLFGVQGQNAGGGVGAGTSDRGVELDGGNSPDNSQPFGLYRMYNVTLVGKGLNGADGVGGITNNFYSQRDNNSAIYMRDNAGPQIYNSVFADFGGWAVHMENEGGDGKTNVQSRFLTSAALVNTPSGATNLTYAATLYRAQDTNGYQGEIAYNIFWQIGSHLDGRGMAALSTADLTASAASDASTISQSVPSTNVFLLASGQNNITNALSIPIASYSRETGAGLGLGQMLNVTSILPLAVNDATSSAISAPQDGFFTPVNYRGAFSSTNNWIANWTTIYALGLTPSSHVNPSAPAISVALTPTQAEISIPTANGVQYSLESSYDVKHWSPVALINGDGTTQIFVDSGILTNSVQYRVVIP